MQRRHASALELAAQACGLLAVCAFAGCDEAPKPTSPDATIDAEHLGPFVVRWVPSGGDSSVATDVIVSATFSKPVTGITTYSFKLTRRDIDAWHAAFVYYDEATRTATLHPQTTLDPSRAYVATLTQDIVDMQGAQLVGTTSWVFSIAPDTAPPAVTMTSPTSGAANVPVDTTIVATLSEPISGITTASFFLQGPNGTVVAPVDFVSKTVVSLTPRLQLAPHTVYTVSLTSAIKDFAGNPLMGTPIEWSFTTGADTIAPIISSRIPEDGESEIPLTWDVKIWFSEPVIGVSTASITLEHAGTLVPASVTYSPSSRRARLTPDASLSPNTTYTVTVNSSITDASGNAAGPLTWTFETGSEP